MKFKHASDYTKGVIGGAFLEATINGVDLTIARRDGRYLALRGMLQLGYFPSVDEAKGALLASLKQINPASRNVYPF